MHQLSCRLFSAIGWLSQPTVVSRLPATHVRAIASAVWLRRGEENLELLLSQDIFRLVQLTRIYICNINPFVVCVFPHTCINE